MRIAASAIGTTVLVGLGEATNRTFALPMLVLFPTSRCNSRCVSCDWWQSSGAGDLTMAEVRDLAASLQRLGTRLVVFSGGEPLLRREVFDMARLFQAAGMTLHLLTSGLLLERMAADVARVFARVTISLDAADAPLYRTIRGVDGFHRLEQGVAHLRRLAPALPITARTTVHRRNFRQLAHLIACARAWKLDGISFLPADVSSTAFGRHAGQMPIDLALTPEEAAELDRIIDGLTVDCAALFASGFIEESPARLRRLPQYYRALAGDGPFPAVACNAPSVSVVVEADGSVRPCFFHQAIGNIRRQPLEAIVKRALPAFRRSLDMAADPVCRRCVCSIKTDWRRAPWR